MVSPSLRESHTSRIETDLSLKKNILWLMMGWLVGSLSRCDWLIDRFGSSHALCDLEFNLIELNWIILARYIYLWVCWCKHVMPYVNRIVQIYIPTVTTLTRLLICWLADCHFAVTLLVLMVRRRPRWESCHAVDVQWGIWTWPGVFLKKRWDIESWLMYGGRVWCGCFVADHAFIWKRWEWCGMLLRYCRLM